MIQSQILEAIKQMSNLERLEIIEFALQLVREEMKQPKSSLAVAAEMMSSFYQEGSELTEFADSSDQDFYEYPDYA